MTDAVSPKWRQTITDRLAQIAKEEDILILLAIESGSRAWGFHSTDSDYDVRFIYARPTEWHLTLNKKRDVVERPIDDDLDLSGWALDKTLKLAIKGNAVVAEWLQSPIVYHEQDGARDALMGFCQHTLHRRPMTWHYKSLAFQQREKLFNPDGSVRLKRFFYTLRPTLALRWMRLNGGGVPPMDMTALRAGCALERQVNAAIDDLIARKAKLTEKDDAQMEYDILIDLITSEDEQAAAWLSSQAEPAPRGDVFDRANALHLHYTQLAGR